MAFTVTVSRVDRCAGVEAYAFLRHPAAADEPWIGNRIVDDQGLGLANGVVAERLVAACLSDVDADLRLEPLAIAIDQRKRGDRAAEHVRGERGQRVELTFRRTVEQSEAVQHGESTLLARDVEGSYGGLVHALVGRPMRLIPF